jgi:hypothetical protein
MQATVLAAFANDRSRELRETARRDRERAIMRRHARAQRAKR